MFQPFNESFVQSTVEATLDHRVGETEELALCEGQSYQPNKLMAHMNNFLNTLRVLTHRGHSMNTNSHTVTIVRPNTSP
jgi:hypothetical protein